MRAAARRLAAVGVAAAAALAPAAAAETRLRYDAGLSETYSQDVLRIGDDAVDDFITSLALTGGLEVRTARSRSEFSYTPGYFAYSEFTDLNHLDHRYRGLWSVRPGARSTFGLRQGFSETTRQVGFTDLDGAGSDAGQPVVGLSRRRAWEVEPEWDLERTARSTLSVRGLYRSEGYERQDLVDSDQYGIEAALGVLVGRGQRLGGRVRGDRYRYPGGAAAPVAAFDRFTSAFLTWAWSVAGRFDLSAEAGAFRAGGEGIDPVVGPTADLSGAWRWQRSSLALSYGMGYSSGGGLTSADRSQRGDLSYDVRWGYGFTARISGTVIRREPIETDAGEVLQGRSFAASIEKTWRPGWGIGVGVAGLRQQQDSGADLAYGEASVSLLYRLPVRPERPAPPPPDPASPV